MGVSLGLERDQFEHLGVSCAGCGGSALQQGADGDKLDSVDNCRDIYRKEIQDLGLSQCCSRAPTLMSCTSAETAL